jgi:putative Holliday junction resolvase
VSRTIFALDIGERKIGIARANTIAKIAEPLVTLANDDQFLSKLKHLIIEHQVERIIVGLPRNLEGQDTKQTSYVKEFIQGLNLKAEIVFQDEALTSVNAEDLLSSSGKAYNKEDIDAVAASIILDDYIKGEF